MTGSPDINDRARTGALPTDPKQGARPMNERARNAAARELRVLSVKQVLQASMDRAIDTRPLPRCTTGHWEIDQATGGMRPGHVWVFAAETSWGKSSWLISIADENIRDGKRVLIVSSEDTEELYGDRLMARRARVVASHLRDKTLTPLELERVTRTAAQGEDIPLFVDARGVFLEDALPRIDRIIKSENVDLVAFDYLQEFKTKQRFQDERVRFREIARMQRDVVKDNKRTGIIFSQITEIAGKKYPDKNSIRESRDVANAAEAILIGYEPKELIDREGADPILPGTKCVKIDKAKDGWKKQVPLRWNGECACFELVAPPEPEAHEMTNDDWDDYVNTVAP